MKKLLVLALVVSLTGLASAALSWTSSTGSFDVAPGETITLTLNDDADGVSGVIVDLITDSGAEGVITEVTLNEAFNTGSGAGMTSEDFDAFLVANGVDALGLDSGDWAMVNRIDGSGGKTAADIMTLTYNAGSVLGEVVISSNGLSVLGGNNVIGEAQMPAITLNVVPEPMTVALLGLGGLFLRRRK